jgi:hypothetical protein
VSEYLVARETRYQDTTELGLPQETYFVVPQETFELSQNATLG